MEKCNISDRNIEKYLFGRLEEDEETVFQQHLFACEKCSAKVQRLRRLAEAFHPETIAREEMGEAGEAGEVGEMGHIVPFVRKMRPWLAAASIALVFAIGWYAGQFSTRSEQQLADAYVQTQIESPPEYASGGSAPEKERNEFTFIAPGEGKYVFNVNEVFPEENNVIFKWSPKAPNALLLVKSDDGIWDEYSVKNADHIKINLSKYISYRSLNWILIVSESEDVMKGTIDLRKYLPPYEADVKNINEKTRHHRETK